MLNAFHRRRLAVFIASTNVITVRAVEPGSPAEKAGFKKGDVVLRVDNKPAKNILAVNRELISAGPKREVPFVLERDSKTENVTVRLIPETTFFNLSLVQTKLGCAVQDRDCRARAAPRLPQAEQFPIVSTTWRNLVNRWRWLKVKTASRRNYIRLVMKTKLIAVAVFAAAVLLTGCWQKSVYPFYKEKDVFFDEKLIGSWREASKTEDEAGALAVGKREAGEVYKKHIAGKEAKVEFG